MPATLSTKTDKEIERKFLVKALPPNLKRFENRRIDQGYLAVHDDRTQVRLRRAGKHCTLTVKRGRGHSREEYEVELTPEQFNKLWPATAGRRLRKTRFDIPFGDHVIELDVYSGRNDGLVVAEVEFDNEKDCANFRPPDWFGAEVTGKSPYGNVKLARE